MYCLLFLVPARLGTESFALQKIDSFSTYDYELAKGAHVMVTFTVGWYEWDGKGGEGQKTDGSPSKMNAAGFEKAISSTLQKVIVSVEEHAFCIGLSRCICLISLIDHFPYFLI